MKVFLTGGTGTLGKAIIKRYHDKWSITSFSRDELKLSKIEREYPDVKFTIGDVKDYAAVLDAMKGHDVVIHAAAMKRIEICEVHPMEAVKTNIIGAHNVAMAAYHNRIERAVVTGSDKGANPVNAYGMTKALQERIFATYNFNATRYGNVFASRGSVAPLFRDQSKAGVPLTVTDPEMTRFMLTIDEAIDLIIYALTSPMKGDLFVKKSPAIKLIDLARAFSDRITITGKMKGEKLHEMLYSEEESTRVRSIGGNIVVVGKGTVTNKYGEAFTSDKTRLLTMDEIRRLIALYVE